MVARAMAFAALLFAGCGSRAKAPTRCDPDGMLTTCIRDHDRAACQWIRQFATESDAAAIEGTVGEKQADLDDALRSLFPGLAGKTLTDADSETRAPLAFAYNGLPPYTVRFPIDWQADPYHSNSWQLWFQSLGWLTRDTTDLDVAARAVVDWADHALYRVPPLEWTWFDHAIAMRLDRVADIFARYLAERNAVPRRFVHAVARIMLTHVHALSVESCYTRRHNHGLMQDLALLETLRDFPALDNDHALRDLAAWRAFQQTTAEITIEGIHIENSPGYQVMYAELLTKAVGLLGQRHESIARVLTQTRDRMLEAIIYQLQPNLTFPQFSCTENSNVTRTLRRIITTARRQRTSDPRILDQLEWVVSRGKRGRRPDHVDRVFVDGEYAAFRERWTTRDPQAVITGHLTCNHDTNIHYKPDETSIEIYGYGMELVVDSGLYGYDPRSPYAKYESEPTSHNVLVVDDATCSPRAKPRILSYGGAGNLAWARATHDNFAWKGVESMTRTFAYAKPDAFVVVDHVKANGEHSYTQHFHLHPKLSRVSRNGCCAVVATTESKDGPTIVLTAGIHPDTIETVRGRLAGSDTQGWYFPKQNRAVAETDVIFHYESSSPDLELPVLITIAGPEQSPPLPDQLRYSDSAGKMSVSWRARERSRQITLPMSD